MQSPWPKKDQPTSRATLVRKNPNQFAPTDIVMLTITRRVISSLVPLHRGALLHKRLPPSSSVPTIRPFHLSWNALNSKTPPISATGLRTDEIPASAPLSQDPTQRTGEDIQATLRGESVYATEPVAERVVAAETGGGGG